MGNGGNLRFQKDILLGCFSALFLNKVVCRTAVCFLEYFFFIFWLFQVLEASKNDVMVEGLIYFPPTLPVDKSQSKPGDQPELGIFILRCKAAHTDSQPGTLRKTLQLQQPGKITEKICHPVWKICRPPADVIWRKTTSPLC